ncbi:MAG: hypothetical protein JOS17DRAFT_793693 [Linnemannia elongata]|nr:MAG: hypothetical protein JOS17DRAFT_793693 [Linnemannia elongata]
MLSHSQQRPKFLFVMNTTRLLLDKTLSDSGDVIKSHYGPQYYDGQCVDRDYSKAMEWFVKAADQGDASAQYSTGCHCSYSRAVEQMFPMQRSGT